MTTKLKIDLTQGILEVEGSETFVRNIYRDFKIQFLGEEAVEEEKPTRRRRSRKSTRSKSTKSSPAKAEPAPKPPPYNLVPDLNLGATKDHPSLVEFMDSKLPITYVERNLVFLYYLQYLLKQKPVTMDHVYTCYREAKIRAPLDLDSSLKMTAKDKGWITIAEDGHMSVTPSGKRYVEEQLPQKVKT